jgi:protein TonB
MSEARFKEEVSRRVAAELKRLEREAQQRNAAERRMADSAKRPAAGGSGRPAAPAPAGQPVLSPPPAIARVPAEPGLTARAAVSPTVIPARAAAIPAPTEPPSSAPSSPVLEEPARIKRVIKPIYPGAALRARIGGTVLLRVLVSETGAPVQVEVIRGVTGGLSEAAVAAVRRWTFEPARRNGVPVQGWTTVPIPFEP